MTAVNAVAAADAIAAAFHQGLQHPGDKDRNLAPTTIALPMFRAAGAPPPYQEGVKQAAQLLAESIVYLIEHQLDCSIVPNRVLAQQKNDNGEPRQSHP